MLILVGVFFKPIVSLNMNWELLTTGYRWCVCVVVGRPFPINNFVVCLQFLRVGERELGSPYTGPDALKKGPLFVKKVDTNQGCKAPTLKEDLTDVTSILNPASYIKGASKSTDNISVATKAPEPKPEPQETGLEPKGKDGATGLCESLGRKKNPATTFLTVPGPHSPGPIKSPRPMSRPAFPFAWPLTRVAPSMSSLNSLASSCFDLTDVSFNTEYAPLRSILSKITCMESR